MAKLLESNMLIKMLALFPEKPVIVSCVGKSLHWLVAINFIVDREDIDFFT